MHGDVHVGSTYLCNEKLHKNQRGNCFSGPLFAMRNVKNISTIIHVKRDIERESINSLNQMIKNVFRSHITKIMKTELVTMSAGTAGD